MIIEIWLGEESRSAHALDKGRLTGLPYLVGEEGDGQQRERDQKDLGGRLCRNKVA